MLAELFTDYALWLILGFLLIISELFVTGVIAVFFGIGAIIVGLLTLFGITESLTSQLWLFAVISLVALFGARRHFKGWLTGNVGDAPSSEAGLGDAVGSRVTVLTDFVHGSGHVQMHGAKWDAESSDDLKAGDVAWVSGNCGIVLKVSASQR
ncbi:hypothetical protein A167_01990 [Alcanivorax sp. S71-1-4]|uniref:NfeD family protein n=1 Tax=Alcanivorax sp. S71-1-4 TaxID=1177159 RepID=UPI00135CE832|nr:NfeD family protein [Alcanivorax sp. S71-1-4]KAF0809229.1 hypothetical protein A167_01990 [Alcanivorax sp. S71-1-4]